MCWEENRVRWLKEWMEKREENRLRWLKEWMEEREEREGNRKKE